MDVKKLFRRSKTPEGGSRRHRLSFGAQSSTSTGARRSTDALAGHTTTPHGELASDVNSSSNDRAAESVPPVPRMPQGVSIPEDHSTNGNRSSLPIAAEYDSESFYQRSTSPPAPSFGLKTPDDVNGSTRDSATSNILPGRYDHNAARAASMHRHMPRKPVRVNDTAALGTAKAPNYVTGENVLPELETPNDSISSSSNYGTGDTGRISGHHRQLTDDTLPEGAFVDAHDGLEARSPLLETDMIPGFPTPGSRSAQTPPPEQASPGSDHRRSHQLSRRHESGHAGELDHDASSKHQMASVGSKQKQSLEGVVDLTNTVDTQYHTHWAEPVYHETVIPRVDHVTHEVYDRDIHNHHIQHRMLPIKEVQTLPARHFVPHGPEGELVEVPESHLPGRTGPNQNWKIAEAKTSNEGGSVARSSQSAEVYGSRYVNEDGVPTTEQVWKHPPRISDGTPEQTGGWPLPGDGATNALQTAMGDRKPHETQAESTVDAYRGAMSPTYGKPPAAGMPAAKELAYRQKPQAQRETEANATIAATRAAEKHH